MRVVLLFICSIFFAGNALAATVKGLVRGVDNELIPFAYITVKNDKASAYTNVRGEFTLHLNNGTHTLQISSAGYKNFDTTISVTQPYIFIEITLAQTNELGEIVIYQNSRDKAKDIMRHVREKRKDYLQAINGFSCNTYSKISLVRQDLKWSEPDTTIKKIDTTLLSKREKRKLKKQQADTAEWGYEKPEPPSEFKQINLIESYGEVYYKEPGRYKEIITAFDNNVATRPFDGMEVGIKIDVGEHEIAPVHRESDNPYILITSTYAQEFNFYKNLIEIPSVTNKPVLSPIAASSALNYQYDLTGEYIMNGKKIYRLQVKPIFNAEPLFSGAIYIEDSTWALISADLEINRSSLMLCREFHITQNYVMKEPGKYVPSNRQLQYQFKEGRYLYTNTSNYTHFHYSINPEFPKNTFTNEVRTFTDSSYDKSKDFWNSHRPVELTEREIKFSNRKDSLNNWYSSEKYLRGLDSVFNRITIWNVLLMGVGHRDRVKGYEFMINPLILQLNPLGIGGYRHRFGGQYKQDLKNGYEIDTDVLLDYGFKNKDVKGKIGVGVMYHPRKFIRTGITVGDYYDMINTYASIGSIFSRSNYIRSQTFSISQRMEIINGLYGEVIFDYSDQKPITDLKLEEWSGQIFGAINTPTDFERYIKTELRLELKYRIAQKYMIYKNKKFVIGTDYPTLQFIYRRGIPGLLNSEVNFEYIELGIKDETKVGRLGSTLYNAQLGIFTNRASLRLLEHKYFRGSDDFFFSDPVRSFQLLGPTLNTNAQFFKGHFIHHFDGILLNKIPLLNKLKLTFAGGGGALIIPEHHFNHFEMFGGIERITRIKKQLFRFSVWAVTSDNNLSTANWTIKFGISFFNSFTNKWDY